MDIDKVMQAHVNWRMRLKDYCSPSRTENLDPNTVGKDNGCELGKWIYAEGKVKYGATPEFNELRSVHAKFHREAAAIIQLANENKIEDALKELENPMSSFRQHTTHAVGLLSKLKKVEHGK